MVPMIYNYLSTFCILGGCLLFIATIVGLIYFANKSKERYYALKATLIFVFSFVLVISGLVFGVKDYIAKTHFYDDEAEANINCISASCDVVVGQTYGFAYFVSKDSVSKPNDNSKFYFLKEDADWYQIDGDKITFLREVDDAQITIGSIGNWPEHKGIHEKTISLCFN